MASPPPYRYFPLASPRHIRLLALRPALKDAQPIICSLHEVSLDDRNRQNPPPPYEALSYTWGARTGTIPILCDGRTLLVTPNCESALRHLRHKFKDRLLWIDATCIDQQSVEEKNVQVPLMGEIYSTATRAVIWLGPGLPGDAGMMRRARRMGKAVYVRSIPGYPVSKAVTCVAAKLISAEEIERVRRVCSHDWFRRIWTVQELMLAQSATFLLGRSECPSPALYTYMILADDIQQPKFQQSNLLRMRSRAFEDATPDSRGGAWLRNETQRLHMSDEAEAEETLSLFLCISASCDTTDMRDKVYGMLAILGREFRRIILPPVDYSKAPSCLLKDFTLAMIRSTGTLWPLELIAHNRAEDLPSWVPDLRDPTSVFMIWMWSGVRRRVPHSSEVNLPASPGNPGRLAVRARFIDKVIEVYDRMPIFRGRSDYDGIVDAKRTECLSAWTAVAAAFDLQSDDGTSYFVTDALPSLTPYLRYLRERHDPSERHDQAPATRHSDSSSLRAALGLLVGSDHCDQSRVGTRPRYDDQYDGAALFLTKNSLIGLCKGDIREGDRICQLAGARYPMILRRVGHSREFRFVGIADVNDLDWEQLEPRMRWEKSNLPADELRDITLV
ncbi:heterokaryon incompatibility protein-domain-containing protein [Podospora conica]|nr:heterokaryon incompatibility protein-domain-containing protein [Schizothecium conicum]